MARPGGMGADFAAGITLKSILPALVMMAVATILAGGRGVLVVLTAHCAAWGIFRLASRHLGGLTGDVLGLIVEFTEILVLMGFCIG